MNSERPKAGFEKIRHEMGPNVTLTKSKLSNDEWAQQMQAEIGKTLGKQLAGMEWIGSISTHAFRATEVNGNSVLQYMCVLPDIPAMMSHHSAITWTNVIMTDIAAQFGKELKMASKQHDKRGEFQE